MTYEPVRTYFTTTNAPDGSVIDWVRNCERGDPLPSRALAKKEGWRRWGHDDFNIAVWEGSKLVSWDWMDKVLENDSETMERTMEFLEAGEEVFT